MRSTIRCLAALLCVLLAASASARAEPLLHVPIEQAIPLYLPTAEAQWPGSACNGREDVRVSPDPVADANANGSPALPGPDLLGLADVRYCRAYIKDTLQGYDLCAVLTHELGHLDYVGHSEDPSSVMYPTVPSGYAPCDAAVKQVERFSAHDLAVASFDAYGVPGTPTCAANSSLAVPADVECAVRVGCTVGRWDVLLSRNVDQTGNVEFGFHGDRRAAACGPAPARRAAAIGRVVSTGAHRRAHGRAQARLREGMRAGPRARVRG